MSTLPLDNDSNAAFSDGEVHKALKKMSWEQLKLQLDYSNWASDPMSLCRSVMRCDAFVIKHEDPNRAKKRNNLLAKLVDYVKTNTSPAIALEFSEAFKWFDIWDSCFSSLLELEGQSDVVKLLDSDKRMWAILHRYAEDYSDLKAMIYDYIRDAGSTFIQKVLFEGTNGGILDPDTIIYQHLCALSSAIQMEAYRNNWFDASGYIVIPSLVVGGTKDIEDAGEVFLNAKCWATLDSLQYEMRYLGRTCEFLPYTLELDAESKDGDILLVGKLTQEQILDYICDARNSERQISHFLDIESDVSLDLHFDDVGMKARSKKAIYHELNSFRTFLSYDVANDSVEYSGLLLLEWIKGFVGLHNLGKSFDGPIIDPRKSVSYIKFVKRETVVKYLVEMRMSKRAIDIFIDNVTFYKDAKDLYDCPLIKSDDGYLVATDIVREAMISRAIISNILTRKGSFEPKGKALEVKLLNFFKARGFEAVAFEKTFDDGKYEYDVLVVWEDRLFVFECKNRWLTEGRSAAIYNKHKMIEEDVEQVNRLVAGLSRYPDIITLAFGREVYYKEIIPCVVGGLPMAMPARHRGIYFSDYAVIARFFHDRDLRVNGDVGHFKHGDVYYSQWKGETPNSDDFLKVLGTPPQYWASFQALEKSNIIFHLGRGNVIRTSIPFRRELDYKDYVALVKILNR